MSRLPGGPAGQIRTAEPDIYTVLLLIGVLFLLVACICTYMDLAQNYGMTFVQLFTAPAVPQ